MIMNMKQLLALLLSLMLFLLPCLALAEENTGDEAVIGGADGPTAILVAEESDDAEDTAEDIKPLTLAESGVFMLKGMVGIFLVTALIILVLRVLEVSTRKKENTEE